MVAVSVPMRYRPYSRRHKNFLAAGLLALTGAGLMRQYTGIVRRVRSAVLPCGWRRCRCASIYTCVYTGT